MKISIKVWGIGHAQKLISTIETPQLNYDPAKDIFGVPTRDADYFYEIQSPIAMKPRIAIVSFEILFIFTQEEHARAFARWLAEATTAQ